MSLYIRKIAHMDIIDGFHNLAQLSTTGSFHTLLGHRFVGSENYAPMMLRISKHQFSKTRHNNVFPFDNMLDTLQAKIYQVSGKGLVHVAFID